MNHSLHSQQQQKQRQGFWRRHCLIGMLLGLFIVSVALQFSVEGHVRRVGIEEEEEVPMDSAKVATKEKKDDSSGHDREFDYAKFWDNAWKEAKESLQREILVTPTPCPKVYVYDIPSNLIDAPDRLVGIGKEVNLTDENDKETYGGLLFETNQFAFPSILEQRLRQSSLCHTTEPSEADLFFAPILPAPKGRLSRWKKACSKINADMIRSALPHLNEENACRHFFAIGKGHYQGEPCKGWYSEPIPEFKPFLRLAYSNYMYSRDDKGFHSYDRNDTTKDMYPNLFSVPYPSSLHFKASVDDMSHFRDMKDRQVLMSFIGRHNHGDTQVRRKIHRTCNNYNDKQICNYRGNYRGKFAPDLVTAKGNATFCLEPAGDSPWRKSISDSITFGCIPVLFSELTNNSVPWFWSDWKARGRVLVPRDEFLAGRIDLKKLLQTTPTDLLNLMQATLKEKARRFQYSVDDDQQDGIRVTLDNLHREALGMERQGMCGY